MAKNCSCLFVCENHLRHHRTTSFDLIRNFTDSYSVCCTNILLKFKNSLAVVLNSTNIEFPNDKKTTFRKSKNIKIKRQQQQKQSFNYSQLHTSLCKSRFVVYSLSVSFGSLCYLLRSSAAIA